MLRYGDVQVAAVAFTGMYCNWSKAQVMVVLESKRPPNEVRKRHTARPSNKPLGAGSLLSTNTRWDLLRGAARLAEAGGSTAVSLISPSISNSNRDRYQCPIFKSANGIGLRISLDMMAGRGNYGRESIVSVGKRGCVNGD